MSLVTFSVTPNPVQLGDMITFHVKYVPPVWARSVAGERYRANDVHVDIYDPKTKKWIPLIGRDHVDPYELQDGITLPLSSRNPNVGPGEHEFGVRWTLYGANIESDETSEYNHTFYEKLFVEVHQRS
jgi:hypothetical protein